MSLNRNWSRIHEKAQSEIPHAAALASPLFRKRVKPSAKVYSRKRVTL
jgi:hypothetical protein